MNKYIPKPIIARDIIRLIYEYIIEIASGLALTVYISFPLILCNYISLSISSTSLLNNFIALLTGSSVVISTPAVFNTFKG